MKTIKKNRLFLTSGSLLALVTIFIAASFVGGVLSTQTADGEEINIAPFKDQSVVGSPGLQGEEYKISENVIYSIVSYVYMAFGAAAIFFILLAAYNFLIGGQDEKKLATAKTQLKYAVIAIVIALISGGASLIINSFLLKAGE